MNLVVNEALKAYIDPLTAAELAALERSLLAEGCRDALVVWGEVLVDGHNRYSICKRHGIPFKTVQATRFQTLEDVHLWMIEQHLGRRSLSDFQRGVLALRQREIVTARRAQAAEKAAAVASTDTTAPPQADAPSPLDTREALAKAARLSNNQVVLIEKIQKQAVPELVAAVKAGTVSINAAAAVASLPAEEQVAAASAGKDELKQAAKRARDAKRRPAAEGAAPETAPWDADSGAATAPTVAGDDLAALQWQVAELTAENAELRRRLAALQRELDMAAAGGE